MTISTADVAIAGCPAPGYFAAPEGPPRGAVVVIHEIFGRAPEMERVCVRLAEAGYAALMPDLFGEDQSPSNGFKPLCVRRALSELKRGEGTYLTRIRAAGDDVAQRSGFARDDVGIIGFCLGGGFALAAGAAFKVTSTNYGEMVPEKHLAGIGPTIACFGDRDRKYRGNAPVLQERLVRLGVPHEVHTLQAGHAFLADGDHPTAAFLTRLMLDVDPVRDSAARDEGWLRILDFFERHLAVKAA